MGAGLWLRGGGNEQAPQVAFSSLAGQASPDGAVARQGGVGEFLGATSCSGCIKEMPQLVSTHHKYANQGYETVAVAMSYDPPDYVREYASAHKCCRFCDLGQQGGVARRLAKFV